MESETNGKLPRNTVQDVADKFGVHVWTVGRIIPKAKSFEDSKSIVNSLKMGNKGRVGGLKFKVGVLHEKVYKTPWKQRRTFAALIHGCLVSVRILHIAIHR